MSSPLGIGGVTIILLELLNDRLINHTDLASIGTFAVSALPPSRVKMGANEENRINLFLYLVTPNHGWRNQGLPSTGSNHERLTNPPLALDLHYLLTFYGKADGNAEILLGHTAEIFNDMSVLSRADIRKSLNPTNPININLIPKDEDGRLAVDLADQIEQLKITPNFLTADEYSRLWSAMQAPWHTSMAYQVSTVLIQHKRPAKSPLPVLTRGVKDRGISVQPNLHAPTPITPTIRLITIQEPTQNIVRDAAELGDTLIVEGSLLEGDKVTALFNHKLLAKPLERPVKTGATAERVEIELPKNTDLNASHEWPAGPYSLVLQIERTGKSLSLTNASFFAIAPRISAAPAVSGTANNPSVSLQFYPEIRETQEVYFFVGGNPFKPKAFTGNVSILTIPLTGIKPTEGAIPVSLRVDGVDSILVRDKNAQLPQFDPQQTITLPL